MPETIVVLDPLAPERADRLRALLPPGFVLTHGTARGDDHLKEIIAVVPAADPPVSQQDGGQFAITHRYLLVAARDRTAATP